MFQKNLSECSPRAVVWPDGKMSVGLAMSVRVREGFHRTSTCLGVLVRVKTSCGLGGCLFCVCVRAVTRTSDGLSRGALFMRVEHG